jgi:hypothetical protein
VSTITATKGSNNTLRTFSWDSCTYGAGRLCTLAEDSGESQSFTYTALGAVQTRGSLRSRWPIGNNSSPR